jgi:hypothetical protein
MKLIDKFSDSSKSRSHITNDDNIEKQLAASRKRREEYEKTKCLLQLMNMTQRKKEKERE